MIFLYLLLITVGSKLIFRSVFSFFSFLLFSHFHERNRMKQLLVPLSLFLSLSFSLSHSFSLLHEKPSSERYHVSF